MSNDTLSITFDTYPNVTGSKTIISSSYSIYVLDCNDDDAAEPDYEYVSIPGRNGDLTLWNKRYKNKMITYKCLCTQNAMTNVPAFYEAILASPGYVRLEDTLHSTYFKRGVFEGAAAPGYADGGKTARFDLTFNCKPQKWLLSGEEEISITSSGVNITNPTNFPAYPLLMFKGYGSVYITEYYNTAHTHLYTFSITDSGITPSTQNKQIRYDSDIFDAWEVYSGDNFNQYVTSLSSKMQLTVGKTRFTTSSSSTLKISLIPRWWTL